MNKFIKSQQELAKDILQEEFGIDQVDDPKLFRLMEKIAEKIITHHTESLQARLVEAFEEKAKLTENPIEENGELIDGSYYQIYKGDFLTIINSVFKEKV